GPMTMIDTLYDAHYGSREELAREFAALLNQEARELEAAGVDIIQFDEPAFNVFFDDVRDWGVEVLERAAEGLRAETVVHICYGYGIKTNTDWKASLGTEWRQYEETFPLLRDSVIDTVSLESRGSHVPMELVELLRGKKVMLGAIDVADPRVETPEEVADTLRRALAFVDADRLCPSTNCGMAPLSRTVAQGKMRALAAGAALLRAERAGSWARAAAGRAEGTRPGEGCPPRAAPEPARRPSLRRDAEPAGSARGGVHQGRDDPADGRRVQGAAVLIGQ